jgi:hypothetical protein
MTSATRRSSVDIPLQDPVAVEGQSGLGGRAGLQLLVLGQAEMDRGLVARLCALSALFLLNPHPQQGVL